MRNTVVNTDCIGFMNSAPSGAADLVFADPPFNIGYQYDKYDDKKSRVDYLEFTKNWLVGVRRIISNRGSLFVAIGDDYAADVKLALDDAGFVMRNWLVWHYTFGVNCKKKFARCHTHIFYYVANPHDFTFNADDVKIPSRRQELGDKRAAGGGKIPGDVWDFSRVCGTFKERGEHPCQMPQALLERIVRVASNPGDLVFDPFSGSGTTLAAAKKLGRDYLGCEISEKYHCDILARLSQ